MFSVSLASDNSFILAGFEDCHSSVYKYDFKEKKFLLSQTLQEEGDTFVWNSFISRDSSKLAISTGSGKIKLFSQKADYFKLSRVFENSGSIFTITAAFDKIAIGSNTVESQN